MARCVGRKWYDIKFFAEYSSTKKDLFLRDLGLSGRVSKSQGKQEL